jgi:hypothetical protein
MSKLLIAIPVKSSQMYRDRMNVCEATWLKNCGVDYKGFTDADLGLVEIDQHHNETDPIRTHRTQRMAKYAYDNGYDYVFRTDTDSYVWVNRLLACGFEQHDYMGWRLNIPQTGDWCLRTAHGGIGFFLSRRAMKVIINAEVDRYGDGKFWGDLWAGHKLWKAGIECHRDTRFLDGSGHPHHHGNIFADELPVDHPYISIHPVPPENMLAIHKRFKNLPAETVPPTVQLWD